MSHRVLEDACIGCGACDFTCPTGALTKTESFLGVFAIDPFTCDDCGLCVPKCPVDAIEIDASWAVCRGHGCPLSSQRLAGVQCAVWQHVCPSCGATEWRRSGTEPWQCARCDMEMRVQCPRVHQLTTS